MFDKMSAEHGGDALSRQREAEEKLKGGRWMGEPLSYLHFLYFVFVFHAFCIPICKREAEEKLKGGRWVAEPLSYLCFLYFEFVFHAFCICICKREAEEKLKGGGWMAEPLCNVSKKEVAEKGRHFLV